jgi:hypothetical protein
MASLTRFLRSCRSDVAHFLGWRGLPAGLGARGLEHGNCRSAKGTLWNAAGVDVLIPYASVVRQFCWLLFLFLDGEAANGKNCSSAGFPDSREPGWGNLLLLSRCNAAISSRP